MNTLKEFFKVALVSTTIGSGIAGCIAIVFILIIIGPFGLIWASNILFELSIGYTLKTWFAAAIIIFLLRGGGGSVSTSGD